MAVKTDIIKAYDRLEWGFLERVLLQKGFAPTWVSWIMECVRSVSFSVLINGTPHGFFEPSRGIRQGDPLSPYLFILCSDVLSSLFSQATGKGRSKAFKLVMGGPGFRIYSSPMIPCFSLKQIKRTVKTSYKYFKIMVMLLVN